jgi:hypothetical protein
VGAGIEALGTVASVEEKGLAALDRGELVAEALDLRRRDETGQRADLPEDSERETG